MKRVITAAVLLLGYSLMACDKDADAADAPSESAEAASATTEEAKTPEYEVTCEEFLSKFYQIVPRKPPEKVQKEVIAGCKKEGDIAEHRSFIDCFMKIEEAKEAKECGESRFIKGWIDAGREAG